MSRPIGVVLLVCVCAAELLLAQTTQPPSFRVQVDAIEIDASVTDARGNTVTDLTQDDFEILEDGRPQTITSFSLVDIPRVRPERPLFAAGAIEPDVQSNTLGEGRLYVFALDQVRGEQILRTRRFVRRFIEQYFGPNDLGAVVFLGGADHSKAQGLTSSPRLLLQAVDAFSGGFADDAAPTSAPGQTGSGPSPPAYGNNAERNVALRESLSSFRQVVEYMAAVRGRRKALLLFSQGYPAEIWRVVDYGGGTLSLAEEDMHRAVMTATHNNVVIYPIDPRGLTADGGLADTATGPSTDATDRFDASVARLETRQGLVALANATGGFALSDSNSFEHAFDRIVEENSRYYVLGFSSTNDRRDGRFRRVQVRVKRPGLVVRSRGGYIAPLRHERPAEPPRSAGTMSRGVADALRSPVAVTGLPMRVVATPFKGQERSARVILAVEVDGSQLDFVQKDDVHAGALEVSYFATDMHNRFFPGQTQKARLALKADTYQQVMSSGLRMLLETDLPAGRYQVRVAAGNLGTKTGSVVYDIDVPDFRKTAFVLSGVAIGSDAASHVTTMNAKATFAATLPGTVSASRDFAAGDVVGLYVEAYDNQQGTAPHTVSFTAELRADGGTAVRTASDDRSSSELKGKRGGYGFTALLPLTGVAPGAYVIHVEARNTVGARSTVSRDIQIRVR